MKFVTGLALATALLASTATAQTFTFRGQPDGPMQMVDFFVGGRTADGAGALPVPPKGDKVDGLPALGVTATHQWPGVYFSAAFRGDEIVMRFNDNYNRYRVSVDGQEVRIVSQLGDAAVRLTGLGAGDHLIRVEKLSESQGDTGAFNGFLVPKGNDALPAPVKPRQIEFIGDSFSVGYGNISVKRECTDAELWATTDTQQAFGPLTAKHFDADYQVNAFSGRGIVRNYDGFVGDPVPAVYPYILFDKAQAYEMPSWQPQVVFVALGGNDFSTPVHAGEKWADDDALRADYEASFVVFVKALRARYPQAQIVLGTYSEDNIMPSVKRVVERVTADGDSHVSQFDAQGPFELMGCHWHLNAADDRRISAQLIEYLDAHPDFWQGK